MPRCLRQLLLVVLAGSLALAAGCGPKKVFTDAEIPSIAKLGDLMWSQAQAADPAFKRIGKTPLADEDYAAVAMAGARLKLTSVRLKEKGFSKGAEFDGFADTLHGHAEELAAAADAKDADKTNAALVATKDTCRSCHKKFR